MGKRSISRSSPFDFICYAVIAVLAALISARVITDIVLGYIALSVWFLLPIILDYLSIKSKTMHNWINGKETILIKHGKILEENLM